MYLGQFEESLEYFKKYDKRLKTLIDPIAYEPHLVGYAYWVNGFKEEAEYYIIRDWRFIMKCLNWVDTISRFYTFS